MAQKTNAKHKLPQLLAFDAEIIKEVSASINKPIALIGVDEVGRGSMIGPVTAAAACLPESVLTGDLNALTDLNDSKQIPETKREALAEWLQENTLTCVAHAEKKEVDSLNVHHASLLALFRAYSRLIEGNPDYFKDKTPFVLIDGRANITEIDSNRQRTVIKGDGKSAVIAAASVVAKTVRDNLIRQYAVDYPGYGWDTNMGYPTPPHKRALAELGPTPLHRCNYKPVQAQLSLPLK